MVIGFDGSRAFSKNRTGTENYSFALLKALAKIDKKNKYLVYVRSRLPRFARNDEYGWPRNFEFKEISWPRLWTQGGLAISTFIDPIDVLFVPAHTLPLIRRPGLKTVITIHDLGAEYLPKMHQIKQRLYLAFMQKFQLKSATKIIAVSKATKEDLVKKIGIDSKRVEVVYEGYNDKLFKNDTKVYSLGGYYLFVGTIQPRKNLERVIKAYAKVVARDFATPDLVIAGSKGWLSDEIYKLPKELGIGTKVKFLGYVPDEKLPALYKGAIALIFPSLFEGFGLPILEAQAVGCPVITSNISSMPEVGGKGAVYVNPYSEEDIMEGMVRIKNKELRIKLVKAGLENIKKFSWEKCARETLEILEQVSLSQ